MAQLSTKVKAYVEAAGKTVDFTKDVLLQDDSQGAGPYIKEWNIAGLSQPTDAELAVHDSAGDISETNGFVRSTRKAAYGNIGDQLDEIYKDIDSWKARIKSIKTNNPKS